MDDRVYIIERRRAAITEARALLAYAEGRLDDAALQRELRRAEGQRERAERMVLTLKAQMYSMPAETH